MKLHWRILLVLGFVTYFILSYFYIGVIATKRGIFHDLALPSEERFPFIPATFIIYLTVYIVPVVAFFLLKTEKSLRQTMWAFGTSLLFCNIVWLVYPVNYELRPALMLGEEANWFWKSISFFYNLDNPPLNCFPSLHVTYAYLSYYVMKTYRPEFARFFGILAILIGLSTLTFKQHYIVDVLAGMTVAYVAYSIFMKEETSAKEWFIGRNPTI